MHGRIQDSGTGVRQRVWETQVPQWGSGAGPGEGCEGLSLPEVQILLQWNSDVLWKKTKLELKMFYQTYTARKPPSACTPVTPTPPAATQWSRLLLNLVCSIRRKRSNAWSLGTTQQFSVCWSLVTLTFDLWPWHSELIQAMGTKHVFDVNLAHDKQKKSKKR